MPDLTEETIVAIATPPGRGGVGIIRLSGPSARRIGETICGKPLSPRQASFSVFSMDENQIDEGIALYFAAPNSFTGEDVIELQGHGGPVVQNMLLEACLQSGAKMANPGEFSQRAFLNDRMDLTQAEAIADLINASTEAGVRAANHSLQGVFSQSIHQLQDNLTRIRVFIEAAIDFPEEEIDFIGESDILEQISSAKQALETLLIEARRGLLFQEGARVAIIGRPNAGKSSLLNQLAGQDVAIVTDIAGTTRDAIEQQINLDGIPVTFIDTAGLHDTPDQVEKIGIERTRSKAANADLLLVVFDATDEALPDDELLGEYSDILNNDCPMLQVANKIDLAGTETSHLSNDCIAISATQGTGIQQLIEATKQQLDLTEREPLFSARSRHVDSLNQCLNQMQEALQNYQSHQTAELLAEDLRQSQKHLGEITGDISADDLLGEIFSSFCIGK